MGFSILNVLPKICPSLPVPSNLKSLFETVLWNPSMILEVSKREQTPIPSPPIARRLAYEENVSEPLKNKKRNASLRLIFFFKFIQVLGSEIELHLLSIYYLLIT